MSDGRAQAAFYLGHRETEDLDLFSPPGPDLADAERTLDDARQKDAGVARFEAAPPPTLLLGSMSIRRTPWSGNFPAVFVHTSVAARDAHPDYVLAKSGDRTAAVRLSSALLSDDVIERIRQGLRGVRPIIVPVRAIETEGINLIPDAIAHELGERFGLNVTTDIVQTNMVGHTRADGFHRLAFQPAFDGSVARGGSYLLVDDHVGLGATLANLRGHIETRGGRAVLATTLTASRRSEVLALRPETLQALEQKHGSALEKYWCRRFGFGIEELTEAEAGYLARAPTLDRIRAGLAEARGEGVPARVSGDQGGDGAR